MNGIGNLVDSFKEFSNTVVEHKVFEIILDQFQSYEVVWFTLCRKTKSMPSTL